MNKEELDDALNMVDSWSAYCSVWMMYSLGITNGMATKVLTDCQEK